MKAYSFATNHLFVNGVEAGGWAEGDDVLVLERYNDSASHKIGADGRMALSLSSDRSGSIKIKLMQTSSFNKYLNGLLVLQEGGPASFVPVSCMWQDSYRQDQGIGSVGYLMKPPTITRGVQQNEQEWTIVAERLDLLLGAPAFAGLATVIAENV